MSPRARLQQQLHQRLDNLRLRLSGAVIIALRPLVEVVRATVPGVEQVMGALTRRTVESSYSCEAIWGRGSPGLP